MGDEGEFWNDVREAGKERRAHNREQSPKLLQERGIGFECRNAGAHLIVTHNGHVVDYWPGTGLWKERNGCRGRGVRSLITRVTK